MKQIVKCINCGSDWKTTMYNTSDGLTLSSYWCSTCEEQVSIIAEDKSA